MKILLAIVAGLVGFTAAASFSRTKVPITQPNKGSVWTAGQKAIIQFSPPSDCSKDKSFSKIELLTGPSNTTIALGVIGYCKTCEGTFLWVVDKNMPNGSDYSIRINSNSYSNQFPIKSNVQGNPAAFVLPAVAPPSDAPSSDAYLASMNLPVLMVMLGLGPVLVQMA